MVFKLSKVNLLNASSSRIPCKVGDPTLEEDLTSTDEMPESSADVFGANPSNIGAMEAIARSVAGDGNGWLFNLLKSLVLKSPSPSKVSDNDKGDMGWLIFCWTTRESSELTNKVLSSVSRGSGLVPGTAIGRVFLSSDMAP